MVGSTNQKGSIQGLIYNNNWGVTPRGIDSTALTHFHSFMNSSKIVTLSPGAFPGAYNPNWLGRGAALGIP